MPIHLLRYLQYCKCLCEVKDSDSQTIFIVCSYNSQYPLKIYYRELTAMKGTFRSTVTGLLFLYGQAMHTVLIHISPQERQSQSFCQHLCPYSRDFSSVPVLTHNNCKSLKWGKTHFQLNSEGLKYLTIFYLLSVTLCPSDNHSSHFGMTVIDKVNEEKCLDTCS